MRTPFNIAIVIDKSGSMAEKKKLDYVKKSVDHIIDQLGRDDYVSVITFDDYVSVLQRSSMISDKYDLREKVSKIQAGGYTNLSDGMFEGYDQVYRTYSKGYVNRVLLLTDGLANRGIIPETARAVVKVNAGSRVPSARRRELVVRGVELMAV